jgi:hypothetical protein
VDKFKKNIEFIKKHRDYYTIGMGDFIDNVQAYAGGQVDKRWNPETVDRTHMTSEEQIDWFLELWKPIAHKSWGLISGNHEFKTINQRAFINQMCKPLNQTYLGRLCYLYVDCKYRSQSIHKYLILALHGGYAGMMAGGAVNRMKAIGGDFDADLILMGHSHSTFTVTGIRVSYDPKKNEAYERKIIYCNTGTFLKGYSKGVDSYVEINPKEAKRVGTVTISMIPYTRDIYAHD